MRFSEFLRLLHLSKGKTITKKVLAQQLRELERDGLIGRRIYPEVPPKVEYCFTECGQSTRPVIDEIVKWGHGCRSNSLWRTARVCTSSFRPRRIMTSGRRIDTENGVPRNG